MSFYQNIYTTTLVYRNGATPNATTVTSQATAARTIAWPATAPTANQVLQSADVNGNLQWATVLANGSTLLAADGTAAAPGVSFAAETDVGMYRIGADILGFSTAGTERLRIAADGTVTVVGDFVVLGTTTTINTQTLSVEDPLIFLANGNDTTDLVDIGFYGLYDTSGALNLYGGLFRDATDNTFKFFTDLQVVPGTTVDTGGAGYTNAAVLLGSLTAANTSNQLVLGTTTTTTINAAVPAASAVYGIVDVGTAADFLMTKGAQSVENTKFEVETISALATNLVVGTNKRVMRINASANAVGVTLPAVAGNDGLVYTFIVADATNAFTINSNAGTEFIDDGATTSVVLDVQWQRVTLMCNETDGNWIIV
jgi:hypothetical protein